MTKSKVGILKAEQATDLKARSDWGKQVSIIKTRDSETDMTYAKSVNLPLEWLSPYKGGQPYGGA